MKRWAIAIFRLGCGVTSVGVGMWVLVNTAAYRQAEAWSSAKIVDATVGTGTHLADGAATVFVGLDTGRGIGLRIDQLCSTSGLAGVMLVVTGLLLVFARLGVHRAFLGLGAMIGLVTAVNLARITVLAWSVTRWGLTGWFEWLHLYGGAAISMIAIVVGCAIYLSLIRRSPLGVAA